MNLKRSDRGLSLVETLVAITIFALITIGIVPLLGTAMRGSAATRTESVGRNLAAKTLERLRGLQYHTAYSATPRKVDLLDHFFPGRTPAYAPPSTKTGFDTASNSFVTTCDNLSTAPACKTLPSSAEIPDGYTVEVRLTFKDVDTPSTTVPVPASYAWDAATDQDAPPSLLAQVNVTTTWTVGASQRTFNLASYLADRQRASLPSGSGPPPPPPPGPPAPPASVKLRAEARIDYAVEGTTTYQDTQSTPRKTDVTLTMGTAQAYGEQLDSGSKADLTVRAGTVRAVRAADPADSGDAGVDSSVTGAVLDAHAPPDATSTTTTTTTTNQTLNTTEVNAPNGMGYVSPSQAGTLTGTRGAGPIVTGGLPFVKGYYDFNGTTSYSPVTSNQVHMWLNAQYSPSSSSLPGSATTENPYNVRTSIGNNWYKMLAIRDPHSIPGFPDPRGEVEIDSTDVAPASTRVVHAKSTISPGGSILFLPTYNLTSDTSLFMFEDFTASVTCDAKADPAYSSTATGSWSAKLRYHHDSNNNSSTALGSFVTTLPTQTLTGNPHVPVGDTNPLQTIKNLNGGNGPLVYDNSNSTYEVYLFEGNGKRGILKDWSMSGLQTSISADDRVVSAEYNGIIRVETSPLRGPLPTTAHPQSDMTLSIGKLGCKAEDYR